MRFALFATFIGCGGTLAAGEDASTKDAKADGPSPLDASSLVDVTTPPPDGGVVSSLAFENTPDLGGVFSGGFLKTSQQANDGCQKTDLGSCFTYVCPSQTPPSGLASAGTLTLSMGNYTLSVQQDTSSFYFKDGFTFSPGALLGVSASGAEVPAFPTQTISSPGPIAIDEPATISTAQDYVVTWSGGEVGAQVFVDGEGEKNNGSNAAGCYFDAAAGTGTIPQAALAALKGVANGQLYFGQQRKTSFTAGSFAIDLLAIQSDTFFVTFQ